MIFMGCFYPKQKLDEYIRKSRKKLSNAGNTFQNSLIDGLLSNGESLDILNVLPVGTWPRYYKDLKLKSYRNFDDRFHSSFLVGSINLPVIKQITRENLITKELNKYREPQDILIYSPQTYFLKAIKKCKVKHNVTLIVTDLPEFFDLSKKRMSIARKIVSRSMYRNMKYVDNFVLITEQMKKPLEIGDRPYLVVEGIYNDNRTKVNNLSDKRIILYSGTLHKQFGIDNLIKAFILIKNENYRLVLCGGGDYENDIKEAVKRDPRIEFMGHVDRNRVIQMQQEATVLVNPRQNIGEYTKYSFPSKTMEYMASGTPVVMYKLDGIPKEYDEYLNYVENNSIESLKNKLVEICEQPTEIREQIGKKARDFILKEKNETTQAGKILKFIKGTNKKRNKI